jgi:hypothetical protein
MPVDSIVKISLADATTQRRLKSLFSTSQKGHFSFSNKALHVLHVSKSFFIWLRRFENPKRSDSFQEIS